MKEMKGMPLMMETIKKTEVENLIGLLKEQSLLSSNCKKGMIVLSIDEEDVICSVNGSPLSTVFEPFLHKFVDQFDDQNNDEKNSDDEKK